MDNGEKSPFILHRAEYSTSADPAAPAPNAAQNLVPAGSRDLSLRSKRPFGSPIRRKKWPCPPNERRNSSVALIQTGDGGTSLTQRRAWLRHATPFVPQGRATQWHATNAASACRAKRIGGIGQARAAAIARNSSLSSIVTLPSAAMQAVTAAITSRFTSGTPGPTRPTRPPWLQGTLLAGKDQRLPVELSAPLRNARCTSAGSCWPT